MSVIYLGRTSRRRLGTCCEPLQEIVTAAAACPACPCDFGVVCGGRGETLQTMAFKSGKSNAKWGQSDHNVKKGAKPWSMAVDLAPYDPAIRNFVWRDKELYAALSAHIMATAKGLGYSLEWGGTYKLKFGKNDPGHFSLLFR